MECKDEWNWNNIVLLYGKKSTIELTGKFSTEKYKLSRSLERVPTEHD